MSYCRWSSDDYQCDVYVYEGFGGWVTHVASRRPVFSSELPPPTSMNDVDYFVERCQIVLKMLDQAKLEPIGLKHDGETFVDNSPKECAETLEYLQSVGYNVPQYAIDALKSEAED